METRYEGIEKILAIMPNVPIEPETPAEGDDRG